MIQNHENFSTNPVLLHAESLFQPAMQPTQPSALMLPATRQVRIRDLAPRDRVVFSPLQNAAIIAGVAALIVGTGLFFRIRNARLRHAQIPAADRAFASLSRLQSLDHAMQQRIRSIADELDLPALGLLVCPHALAVALEQTKTDKPDRVWKRLANRVRQTQAGR